ncbi:MAG: hypothetical protein LBI72_13155 [Flavobacteriaceae bacterium]|jgi:hypothetical protein|nr:hypothetical protein [Flavobacteriaceae bacterium]
MTPKEESLIYDLLTNKIDLDTFYNNYPINFKENVDYFYKKLLDSIDNKTPELLEVFLDIEEFLHDDKYIKNNLTEIYKRLIISDWIPSHLLERFLDSLCIVKENRECYLEILNINKFDKRDVDNIETFMVPIWKKCLWNLYKTGANKETLDILNRYLDSPYEDLKDTAKILIQKTETI